ncbi:MAG: tyrosine-type recombinase/integrase [Myxococcaceae bacterium]
MLNLAIEWGELERAPRIRPLKVGLQEFTFLDFAESARLLSATPPEWKTFVLVALRTGLRVGELLALEWSAVDLVASRLVVRQSLWDKQFVLPKSGRIREVPLSADAVASLRDHRARSLLRSRYVFCDSKGGHLTHSMVKNVVPRACKAAGLSKDLTTHDLRHTFASQLVMRGRSLKEVQELLGHATIEMTLRYAHVSQPALIDAVNALDAESRTVGVAQ